jgi:hypothetical protein
VFRCPLSPLVQRATAVPGLGGHLQITLYSVVGVQFCVLIRKWEEPEIKEGK